MGHVWPQEHQLDTVLVAILRDGQSKVPTEAINDEDDWPRDVLLRDVIREVRQDFEKYFSRDITGESFGELPLPGNSICRYFRPEFLLSWTPYLS